jgi:hypothetical protein
MLPAREIRCISPTLASRTNLRSGPGGKIRDPAGYRNGPEPLLPGPSPPSMLDLAAKVVDEAASHAPHRVDHPHPGTDRGPGSQPAESWGIPEGPLRQPTFRRTSERLVHTKPPHMYDSGSGNPCSTAQSQGPHPRGAGVPQISPVLQRDTTPTGGAWARDAGRCGGVRTLAGLGDDLGSVLLRLEEAINAFLTGHWRKRRGTACF